MCLHRSRGRCMLIVPLSPDRHLTAGMNFVLVCALSAKTTLHNCRASCTSRLAQAHKRAWPRGDEGCAVQKARGVQCDAAGSCVATSRVFATSALIRRMHASLGTFRRGKWPKPCENMQISCASGESKRRELVVAHTSRIPCAQLIFIDHRVVKS